MVSDLQARTLLFRFQVSLAGAIFIFIAAASPSRASLGATNGLSQVCFLV